MFGVHQFLYEIYPHWQAARTLVDGVSSILVHVRLNPNELSFLSFALISIEESLLIIVRLFLQILP